MKRKIIAAIILICFTYISLFPVSVMAESPVFQNNIYKERAISIAKGVAAIYLLYRLNELINDDTEEKDNIIKDDFEHDPLEILRDPGSLEGKVIVIDPGHGGMDPGAVGPNGLQEKDINLDISLKLYQLLKQSGAKVQITRRDDRFINLDQRVAFAQSVNPDLFLSIHSNADNEGIERGIETYGYYNATGEDWRLAWFIQKHMVDELKFKDRGLKAGNFQVIRDTGGFSSLLLEVGYISNNIEESQLSKSETRSRAALGIYKGLVGYFSG